MRRTVFVTIPATSGDARAANQESALVSHYRMTLRDDEVLPFPQEAERLGTTESVELTALKAENQRLREELEQAKWAFEGLRADRMVVLTAMQDEMKLVDVACAIAARQLCAFVPPLTCGNDSRHKLLVPERDHNRIILRCLECDFRQENWLGQV